MTAYRNRADAWAFRLGIASGHWEAVREDLVNGAGELHQLSQELSAHPAPEVQRLSRLTSLRLLDILAWTIGDN